MRNNRASEDIIEAQNREYADRIASKTGYLKSIALDMEQEAKDHHRLLDNLDGDFDSTTGFLSGTMNRVNLMVNSGRGNRKLMCYVVIGTIGLLFFVYMILGKLISSMSSSNEPTTGTL